MHWLRLARYCCAIALLLTTLLSGCGSTEIKPQWNFSGSMVRSQQIPERVALVVSGPSGRVFSYDRRAIVTSPPVLQGDPATILRDCITQAANASRTIVADHADSTIIVSIEQLRCYGGGTRTGGPLLAMSALVEMHVTARMEQEGTTVWEQDIPWSQNHALGMGTASESFWEPLLSDAFTNAAVRLLRDGKRAVRGAAATAPATPSPQTTSSGTAFATAPSGRLVTAHHVVDGATLVEVHIDGEWVRAQVLANDKEADIAVLDVGKQLPFWLPMAPSDSLSLGQRVFTLGYPVPDLLGEAVKYTDGTVSCLSGLGGEPKYMQISVPLQPGNSGGALLDERGRVVGVAAGTAAVLPFMRASGNIPQNINFAVKGSYIPPSAFRTATSIDSTPKDAIERATKSTFRVRAR